MKFSIHWLKSNVGNIKLYEESSSFIYFDQQKQQKPVS